MTDLLGYRFSQYGDVVAAKNLSDSLASQQNFEAADRVSFVQKQYVDAWNNVISQMNTIDPIAYPIRVYDESVNAWRDQDTGRFTSNPAYDEDFVLAARNAGLMFEN